MIASGPSGSPVTLAVVSFRPGLRRRSSAVARRWDESPHRVGYVSGQILLRAKAPHTLPSEMEHTDIRGVGQ